MDGRLALKRYLKAKLGLNSIIARIVEWKSCSYIAFARSLEDKQRIRRARIF
jgi:hypothetical protein